ncbi:peptide ABC transporter permease [Spirochaetia bacterium]|nr:peptide ABC transporter permease [Spirochaetia bacterium]
MLKYIVKRILLIFPVIIGLTLFIYLVLSLAPGDPVTLIMGQDATQEQLQAKRVELGMDKPVIVQYFNYMRTIATGDFGNSWVTGRPVMTEFQQRAPHTLSLAIVTLMITVIVGIPFGVLSAAKQNTPIDSATLVFALIFSSIPAFWLGMLIQILFALKLGWFPAMGAGSLRHVILPALTLSMVNLASQVRMTRSSMLDVINQDYVRTAKAKGADGFRIILRHVMRNGSLPVITSLGIAFANAFGGAVVTEAVFSIPGIGSYMINGAKTRDIPIVMGVIIFVAIFVALVNLVVDLIYAFVDPRVKLGYMA